MPIFIKRFLTKSSIVAATAFLMIPAAVLGYEGRIISVGPKDIRVETDGRIGLEPDDHVRMINRGFLDADTGRFLVKSVSPGLVVLAPIRVSGILEKNMRVALEVLHKGFENEFTPRPQKNLSPAPVPAPQKSFTGTVIDTDGDHVKIKVAQKGLVPAGSRVKLFFEMSSGQRMDVGAWKVSQPGQGTVEAVPVDMIGRPKIGLVAEISVQRDGSHTAENNKQVSRSASAAPPIPEKTIQAHVQDGNAFVRDQKFDKAIAEFELASQKGHADSQRLLGQWYLDGLHVQKDYQKAKDYLKRAADSGNTKAIYSLGVLFSRKDFKDNDMEKAFDLFLKSATAGYDRAQYNVAIMYYKGMGTVKNHSNAFKWFKKSADLNLPEGIYMVGYCYEKGEGINKDELTARVYYQKAASLGEKRAKKKISAQQ